VASSAVAAAKSRATARRSTFPLGRSGRASRMTTRLGAWAPSNRSRIASRRAAPSGAAPAVGASRALLPGGELAHDSSNDDAAPLLIGQADDACLGNGVDAGEGLLHAAGLDLDAAGDDDVVQAPQDLQAPVGAQAATIGGGQEASAGALMKVLGGAGHPVGGVQVALGEDRSGDENAAGAVGVGILDGELDAVQFERRVSIYDEAGYGDPDMSEDILTQARSSEAHDAGQIIRNFVSHFSRS